MLQASFELSLICAVRALRGKCYTCVPTELDL
jgi:hypothetical protein